jgi:peptidoglycan/xylan/chitin deacetylase (PgdA/CDA1 family)
MRDVLVLCYHAVSDRWPDELAIRPQDLEFQVKHLTERGYVATTFTEAVVAPPARRVFAVTFDDAYASVVELGFPVLAQAGVPATLFVPTGQIDTGAPMSWPGIDHWPATEHRDELVGATWDQVAALADAGWEIGSHTVSHPRLPELDDARLAEELTASREELERRLARPCTSIAYPYGAVDERVIAAAGAAGYRTAGSLPVGRFPRPRPLAWPRLMIGRGESEAAYRRHVSVPMRIVRSSPAWPVATAVVPPLRAAQRRIGTQSAARRPPSPVTRLCAENGRLLRRRPLVLAGGVLARLGLLDAFLLWPDAGLPISINRASDSSAARWMQSTFEPRARRVARIDPASWNVIRAGALFVAPGGRVPKRDAVERALGRPPVDPRIAIYSPHGQPLQKATCFLFEGNAAEPSLVIKAIPERARAHSLRHEVEIVERLRSQLGPGSQVADALPLPPLAIDDQDGDYAVCQAVDPLARFTGRPRPEASMAWLRDFHAATQLDRTAWGAEDRERSLRTVEFAWSHAHPAETDRVVDATSALLEELDGAQVPVAAAHGDFWRGNVAADDDGRLRIYDWEWAEPAERPFRDLWAQQLGEVHEASTHATDAELRRLCEDSLRLVEAELELRGLDRRFARATLIPMLAWLSFRYRIVIGQPGGNEASAARIMTVVDQLLFGGKR